MSRDLLKPFHRVPYLDLLHRTAVHDLAVLTRYRMEREQPEDSNIPDDFTIKGAAARATTNVRHQEAQQSTREVQEVCVICLERITERAVTVPCNHLAFDFLCVTSWLQEQSSCPLCKAAVTEVQYEWRGPDDYTTYRVPPTTNGEPSRSTGSSNGRRRYPVRRQSRPFASSQHRLRSPALTGDASLERRKYIYKNQLFSLHVGANRLSRFQNFTPQDFAFSDELQNKCRVFLRRELQVFSFLNGATSPRGNNVDFMLEYVVAILKTVDVKGAGGQAEDLLNEFLGRENARLFLHELEAWLRSPYTKLEDWDRHVQYADRSRGPKADDLYRPTGAAGG